MKYIDAEKMIAEIERQQRRLIVLSNTEQINMKRDCAVQNGVYNSILVLINSLQHEQPDMDLEKEIENEISKYWFDNGYGAIQRSNGTAYMELEDVKEIAKHFFELGLKASQPITSVYGIEEALKENGIDPDSKEADIYREAIYKIYDRFKVQKGK